MSVLISCMVIGASLLALASGIWVMLGLVTELINPSNKRQIDGSSERILPIKKPKTPEN